MTPSELNMAKGLPHACGVGYWAAQTRASASPAIYYQAPPADPQPLEVQGRRRVGRRPAAAAGFAYWPPLQSMTCPVMKLASSEARKAIAAACSSGVPRRFSAWRWRAS